MIQCVPAEVTKNFCTNLRIVSILVDISSTWLVRRCPRSTTPPRATLPTTSSTWRCLWSLPKWCSCQDFGFETAKQSAKNVTRTSDFWRGRVNEALLGCDWGGFQDHLSGAVSEDIKLYLQVSDCHIYLCGDSLYIAMTSH